MNEKIIEWQKICETKTPEEAIKWALAEFGEKNIALSSSFGAEDQVLTHILMEISPAAQVFTLDTGRLPQETHEVLRETENLYRIKIEILRPQAVVVMKMIKENGVNLFYESVEKRKLCCQTRKVEPLKKKLSGLKAWICGLRKGQSVTRAEVQKIEWDETFGLYKVNPLADWNNSQVWEYINKNKVPYNKLHDKGYPSIGCEPCTKSVKPGQDIRAGRWWWENSSQKECGLHRSNNNHG